MNVLSKLESWQARQSSAEEERQRIAFLNKPLPAALNPPELIAPTRVRCLKPFCVGGKPVAIGAEATHGRSWPAGTPLSWGV